MFPCKTKPPGEACGRPSPCMKFFQVFFSIFVLLFVVDRVEAHQVPSVELEFLQTDHQWRLDGEMDIAYMLPETRNIPGGPPLSRAAVMKSPPEEFARIRKETENTLRKLLRFTFDGKPIPWRIEFPDFQKTPFALPPEEGDVALISTRIIFDPVLGGGELRAFWSGEQETELIILIEEGDDPKIMSTLPGGNVLLLNIAKSVTTSKPLKQPETGGWLRSGFYHVLPTGFDHILFILGMFLLVPKWKPLLEQSLLFTIAHSISLALSVYGIVDISMTFVNIMVALSIAWIGIENLFVHHLGKGRYILVFSFGLVHGLGFASGLREKLSGIPREKLAFPLLGYNVGVELAQITVLIAAFVLLFPLWKWRKGVQRYGSVVIALCGTAWLVQRLLLL